MEFDFRQIVVLVALIVLIVVLSIIGYSLSKTKDVNWPPVVPTCPDYWELDGSGNCVNSKGLGTCKKPEDNQVKFTTDNYIGANGPCNKYKWATGCGVSWDGVTYGVPNPCDSTV